MASKLFIIQEKQRRGMKLSGQDNFILQEAQKRNILPSEIQEQTFPISQPKLTREEISVTPEFSKKQLEFRAPKKASEFFSNFVRPLLEGGGSLAGSAIGALPLGTPAAPSAALTIPVGGALGFGVGKTSADVLSRFLGFKKPLKNLHEATKETLSILQEGMEFEALGLVGGAALGKLARRQGKGILKKINIPGRMKRLEAAKQLDIPLSPAEEAGTSIAGKIEGAFELLPFSSGVVENVNLKQAKRLLDIRSKLLKTNKNFVRIEELGEKIQLQLNQFIKKNDLAQAGALNDIKNDLLKRLGSNETIDELGFSAQEAIKRNSKDLFEQSQKLFSKVEKILKTLGLEDSQIADTNLTSTAKKLLNNFDKAPPSILKKNAELIGFLKDFSKGNLDSAAEKFLSGLPEGGSDVLRNAVIKEFEGKGKTWKSMQLIRETLNAIIEEKTGVQGLRFQAKKGGSRPFVLLKKALDQDLEIFANVTGGEVLETFQTANAFFGQQKRIFKDPVIVKAFKAKPAKVIDDVIRPNSVRDIKVLKQAIGEKNVKLLEDGFITNILELDKVDTFSPEKALRRFDKFGESTLSEVIGEKKLKELTDILKKGINIENIPSLSNNSVFRDILNKRPEKILDSILIPDNSINISVAKQILSKDAIANLKQASLEKIFTTERGLLSPLQLSQNINDLAVPLKNLFSEDPKFLQEIIDFADGASLAKGAEMLFKTQKTGQSFGGKIILASEIGLTVFSPVSGATALLTPPIMAKLWFSKEGKRLLLEGIVPNLTINEGAKIFTKLIAVMSKQKLKKQESSQPLNVGKIRLSPQKKRKRQIRQVDVSNFNNVLKQSLAAQQPQR